MVSGDLLVAAHIAALRSDTLNPDVRARLEKIVAGYDAFFAEAFKHYEYVLYIAGNHEHYGSDVEHTLRIIEARYKPMYPNLHILEKEAVQVDDVLFFGATMWTNFNGRDTKTMQKAFLYMSDYQQIWINDDGDTRRITPGEIYEDHLEAVRALEHYTLHAKAENLKMVVMTHHAPSKRSTHPRYVGEYEINGAYSSNLEGMMGDPIKLWVHGHTHDSYDYTVRDTRIMCNPRGYVGHALNGKFQGDLVVQV